MKVMISTDIEGASGVVGWEQTHKNEYYFPEARRFLTSDVNAAVEGALAGGATEIWVVDAHGRVMNILFEDLHPEAQLVWGSRVSWRPQLVMQGLDDSFDLCLLVGMHAAAHNGDGILSHSYHGPATFFDVKINGMFVGEPEIATALAGAHGVPCGLITCDDVTAEEYLKLRPDSEAVIVKYAIDRGCGRCLSLKKTYPMIRDAAQRAVERGARKEFEPWTFEPPIDLEVTVTSPTMARAFESIPKAERRGHRVVGFKTDDFFELYELLLVSVSLLRPLKDDFAGNLESRA